MNEGQETGSERPGTRHPSTLAGLRFKPPASTPSPRCPAQIAHYRDLLCPLVAPARS